MFARNPGAYQSEAPFRVPLALPTKIRLGRKGLTGPNTSLLRKYVNYCCKKFSRIGPTTTKKEPESHEADIR